MTPTLLPGGHGVQRGCVERETSLKPRRALQKALREAAADLEQKAAGAQRREGAERKDQRLRRAILTASRRDGRYCCRYFDGRLSNKESSDVEKGLTVSPEALTQDKQAVTLKRTATLGLLTSTKLEQRQGTHRLNPALSQSKGRALPRRMATLARQGRTRGNIPRTKRKSSFP